MDHLTEFPRCRWYMGDCTEPGDPDLDGLCAFHFDACERSQHYDAQLAYDLLTPEQQALRHTAADLRASLLERYREAQV